MTKSIKLLHRLKQQELCVLENKNFNRDKMEKKTQTDRPQSLTKINILHMP